MKNLIRYTSLMLLFVFASVDLHAAKLSVRSFGPNYTDMTASTQPRTDRNGVPCAVVVVHLPVGGCSFQGNLIGDVAFNGSRYNVYLTDGSKFLQVNCPGVESFMVDLIDGEGNIGVKSKVTYNLYLDGYEALQSHAPQPTAPAGGYLTVNVTPKTGFVLKINGNMEPTENGEYVKFLTPGKYDILVEATGYEPYSTQVVIDGSGKKNLDVNLVSIMATLKLNIKPTEGCMLKINGEIEPIHNGRFEKSLLPGTYNVLVEAPGHDSYSEQIVLGKAESKTLNIVMESNMATLKISSSTPGTIIKIDGKQRGVDNATLNLSPGQYLVEGEKASHRGNSQVVTLAAKETKTVTVPELTPIYGAIDVNYRPTGATISIDGRQVSTTPDLLSQLLIGNHEVTVTQAGFEPFKTTVKVTEGETVALTGTLEEKKVEVTLADLEKKYDWAGEFSEGLALVEKNDKYGFVDTTGQVVIPIKYGGAFSFSEGLALVEKNGQYGFIDKSDQVVIPIKYYDAWSFSEGLAPVKQNGKWGFVDQNGHLIIQYKYDNADSFRDGLARVQLNGKWGYIDKAGNFTPGK